MGLDISNIKDAALIALANSIDGDKNYKGEKAGVLEDGAELSVFLAKSAAIDGDDESELTKELLSIADSADKNTYEMFKAGLLDTIEKSKGVIGYNKLMQILGRMSERFEKENTKVAETDFEKAVAGSGSVLNDREIEAANISNNAIIKENRKLFARQNDIAQKSEKTYSEKELSDISKNNEFLTLLENGGLIQKDNDGNYNIRNLVNYVNECTNHADYMISGVKEPQIENLKQRFLSDYNINISSKDAKRMFKFLGYAINKPEQNFGF